MSTCDNGHTFNTEFCRACVESPKRVRSSKGRDKRYWSLQREITGMWMTCIRGKHGIHATHTRIHDMIVKADVTTTDRRILHKMNWAARDLTVCEHGVWTLYIDGKRASRAELDVHYSTDKCMDRMSGRFEWATGEGFYDDSAPASMK